MKDNFDLHSWKYNQLTEEIRKEIESYIDGIIPLIKKIDFWYTDYGSLYKIKVSNYKTSIFRTATAVFVLKFPPYSFND